MIINLLLYFTFIKLYFRHLDVADYQRFHFVFRIKEVQKTSSVSTNKCCVGEKNYRFIEAKKESTWKAFGASWQWGVICEVSCDSHHSTISLMKFNRNL